MGQEENPSILSSILAPVFPKEPQKKKVSHSNVYKYWRHHLLDILEAPCELIYWMAGYVHTPIIVAVVLLCRKWESIALTCTNLPLFSAQLIAARCINYPASC